MLPSSPISTTSTAPDRHEALKVESEDLRHAHELLTAHFASLKIELLEKRSGNLAVEQQCLQQNIDQTTETLATLRRDEADLSRQIAENGGDRIAGLSGEFRSLLARLREDDLPGFEERFKELLNQNTIREIANFNAYLNQHRETIRDRVDRINQSLVQSDYNPGRYIKLEASLVPDQDLRTFQNELRACTEGSLTGSEEDQYSEVKFLQVKAIVERFRGREGTTELDRRWT